MVDKKQRGKASLQKGEEEGRQTESSLLQRAFTQYADSIEALREFFSRLSPLVSEMEEGILKEREASIERIVKNFGQRASQEEIEQLGELISGLLERFEARAAKKGSKVRKAKEIQTESPLVGHYAIKLLKHIFYDTPSGIHRELLNRSILMSSVSYFEVLVADLAHAFYRIAPDAISTDDKVLSANELKQFSSINEALRSIISDRVDKLLRGSVNDWQEFFQSRMKSDMRLLTPDWAQWSEYFQRRHIMVHAGGHVTERYLSNIDWEKLQPHITRPSIGDKLDIDDAYLGDAINAFEVTGLLLCQEIWRKLVPEDGEGRHSFLRGLIGAVYRRLLSRHWYVAERLATWGERDNEASEDSMLICKFNRWLCIKRQGRWAEVEEEVKAFDCSAKNRRFVLVRASLLEQADEFFELLPKALSADDIDIGALEEWPILDEMRADPRYAKVIAETKRRARRKKVSQ